MLRALVVIPTYNEAENVVAVLDRTRAAVASATILVVDDNSPDGTALLVSAEAVTDERVHLMQRPAKQGLGAAYRAGFAWGLEQGYEVLVEMDGDLSHDPGDLPRLLDGVADGADLVIGSRYVPGGSTPHWSVRRRLLSRWGNRYAAAVLGVPVRDCTAGFRAYSADTLRAIDFTTTLAEGYAFQVEMTYRVLSVGRGAVEVPITFSDRVRGSSKMSSRIVAEAMLLVTWWGIRDRILRRR